MTNEKLDAEIVATLRGVSTATVTMQLLKRGYRHVAMRGVLPLKPGQGRVAGRAYTLRYVPFREDLSTPAVLADPRNSARIAIEECPAGAIYVVDARGKPDTGIIGDILAERMKHRGVAGFVTDGGIRDVAGVLAVGLPCWCAGPASPASITEHTSSDLQVAIGCGDVAVIPGDFIVADDDGAVVIPAALAAEVARDGAEQERMEQWILDQVKAGRSTQDFYPPGDATRAEWAKLRK
jgi:regulator of RNase E activity RraA